MSRCFRVALLLLSPLWACAQTTYYWAGSAHDPSTGGSGNWNGDPNWSTSPSGYTASAWVNGTNNAVLDGSTSGTITLNSYGVSGTSLTLERDYTINTNGNSMSFPNLYWAGSATTLTLTGGGTLWAGISSGTIVLSGPGTTLRMGGSYGVSGGAILAGDGTYLTNANQAAVASNAAVTLAGTATLRTVGGGVKLGSLDSAVSGDGVVENNHGIRSGKLTINQTAGSSSYSGIIRDSSSGPQSIAYLQVAKEGSGTWILGGATKTYTGGTIVDDGTLQLAATNVLPTTGTVSIGLMGTPAGTLDLAGYDQVIGGLQSSLSTAAVNLGSATLTIGGLPATNLGATFTGVISGSGVLVKTGSGLETLSGTNTYMGGTIVEGGTLAVASTGALGSGPVLFKAGTTLSFGINTFAGDIGFESGAVNVSTASYTTRVISGVLSGGAGLNFSGGTIALTGHNTYGGGTTVTNATLVLGADDALGATSGPLTLSTGKLQWTQAFDLAPTRAITLASGGTLLPSGFTTTIAQNIGGPGGLTIDSSGTVVLQGHNTFADGLAVGNQGTVAIADDAALGAAGGMVTIGSGTLRFTASTTLDATRALLLVTGTTNGSTINVDAGATVTVPQAIGQIGSGSAKLVKDGLGTLILEAPVAYTGGTYVYGGLLRLAGGDNTLPAGQPLTVQSGQLDLNGTRQTVSTLLATGVINLSGGTLVVTDTFDTTFNSNFSGTGVVQKTGGGRFGLGDSGGFVGTFQLDAGSLQLGGTLGATSQLVLSSGTALNGTGTVGLITVEAGATIAPGFNNGLNVGTIAAGDVTLAAGARYTLTASSLSGGAGSSADLLALAGTLNLGGTSGDPVVVALVSLGYNGLPSVMLGFNANSNYAKTLLTTTNGITGFNLDNVSLDLAGFQNSYTGEFHLRSANGNKDLVLLYWSTSFNLWAAQHFTTAELGNPAISGVAADPDHDGMTNLVEYALGLDPRQADASGLPQTGSTTIDWTYTYTRPANRPDITYAVEASTDLAVWSTGAVTHTRTATDGVTETWQATVPLAAGPAMFFRLRVDRI